MGVVEQITIGLKDIISTTLPDYTQLDYEYMIAKNSERDYSKAYGVTVGASRFVMGKTIGFITLDQTFQVVLTDDYQNHDADDAQANKAFDIYDQAYKLLRNLHQKRMETTPDYQVLLISAISFEELEFIDDNGIIVLRLNINVQYKFKNNC